MTAVLGTAAGSLMGAALVGGVVGVIVCGAMGAALAILSEVIDS